MGQILIDAPKRLAILEETAHAQHRQRASLAILCGAHARSTRGGRLQGMRRETLLCGVAGMMFLVALLGLKHLLRFARGLVLLLSLDYVSGAADAMEHKIEHSSQ